MDRELDQFFEDYDVETIETEEQYDSKARKVNGQFERKLGEASGKIRFAQDLIAMFRFLQDGYVPWQKKAMVVAGLLYFIVPLDAIPDIAPFVGYLDDMGVVLAIIKFMAAELKPYYPAVPAERPDVDDVAPG